MFPRQSLTEPLRRARRLAGLARQSVADSGWKAQLEGAAAGGCAAGAAWLLAGAAGIGASATVAAIAALLSVSVALHRSVISALRLVAGCACGIVLAGAVHAATGSTAVAITVGAGTGLLAGRLLRIGDDGALQVAITAVILSGLPVGGDSLTGRVAATAAGAGVGILVSALAHRSRIVRQADQGTGTLEREVTSCLRDIGRGIGSGYGEAQASKWLGRARELVRECQDALADTQDAIQHARYSPAASTRDVEPILERAIMIERAAIQVNGIARAAFDAHHAGVGIPAPVGEMLRSVARLMEDGQPAALTQARARHALAAQQLARMDDLAELITTGTILADAGRIIEAASGESPALLVD